MQARERLSAHWGVRICVLRLAGFAALQAWVLVLFFSGLIHYSLRGDIAHLNNVYVCWCCGLVAVSVIGALPWGRLMHVLRPALPLPEDDALALRTWLMKVCNVAAGVLLLACTWILALAEHRVVGQPLCSVAAVASGMAVGALNWSWGTVFVGSFGRGLPVCYSGAFTAAALLYALVLSVPEAVGVTAVSLLPIASVVCLALSTASTRDAMSERRRVPTHCRVMFARAAVTVGLLGFAEGCMRVLFQTADPVADAAAYRTLLPGAMLAAAVGVAVVARVRSGRDTVGRVNHVIMLAMALLFLLTPVVYGLGMGSDLATTVCFCLLYLCTWTVLSQVASAYRLNVRVTLAVGLGASYAGSLLGTVVGAALAPAVLPDYRLQMAATLVCVCLVFASFLFVADGRTFVELLDADSESPSTPRRFQLRCERVAQLYGLTAKELEVMTLIAKGRSVQRIQELLGVAASTVNTHVSHIYRKMGVHSRQEMLDLLDCDSG